MRVIIMKGKVTFARNLRKQQTEVERLLWYKLRNKQIASIKFRRQQPIGPFIVDFVSFDNKLIIELDGSQHDEKINQIKDLQRTEFLKRQGYFVVRFWDNEILNNMNGVLEKIHESITPPHPNPLPRGEREKERDL